MIRFHLLINYITPTKGQSEYFALFFSSLKGPCMIWNQGCDIYNRHFHYIHIVSVILCKAVRQGTTAQCELQSETEGTFFYTGAKRGSDEW